MPFFFVVFYFLQYFSLKSLPYFFCLHFWTRDFFFFFALNFFHEQKLNIFINYFSLPFSSPSTLLSLLHSKLNYQLMITQSWNGLFIRSDEKLFYYVVVACWNVVVSMFFYFFSCFAPKKKKLKRVRNFQISLLEAKTKITEFIKTHRWTASLI